jgi:hypothetical protein
MVMFRQMIVIVPDLPALEPATSVANMVLYQISGSPGTSVEEGIGG